MDSNSVMGQQIMRDIEETARLRSAMMPPEASAKGPDESKDAIAELMPTAEEVATAEGMPEGEEHAEG